MGGRGGSSNMGTGLPAKTVMTDTSAYSGYARELAEVVKGDPVYQITFNGGKAFADAYVNSNGSLRIDFIGSTGNRAGSELMARLAEKALSENRTMSWIADNASAKRYYKHIGVDVDMAATRRYRVTQYNVKPSQLPSLIRRLRNK